MHTTENKLWWDKNLAEEERKAYNLTITYSNVFKCSTFNCNYGFKRNA